MKTPGHFLVLLLLKSFAVAEDLCGREPDPNSYSDLHGINLVVVGGTDGSGTRGVVEVLARMGVPWVFDDPVSLDIHGEEMGGWPSVVAPLLSALKPKEYAPCFSKDFVLPQPTFLPQETIRQTTESLARLVRAAAAKATTEGIPSTFFGIKAPVSLLVIPHLLALGVRLKFVLVTRDGRDIAFSSNRSPEVKFFNATFGQECWSMFDEQAPATTTTSGRYNAASCLRSAQLWSAWNSKVLEWGSACAQMSAKAGRGHLSPRFQFMALRIEDLLYRNDGLGFGYPGDVCSWQRELTLARLAKFVEIEAGDDLCCLCVDGPTFLGRSLDIERLLAGNPPLDYYSSDEEKKEHSKNSGYGKWRKMITKGGDFEGLLDEVAGATLLDLGYTGEGPEAREYGRPFSTCVGKQGAYARCKK